MEAFLIKPVQRLTRYPLFFTQLLKEMKGIPEYAEEIHILEKGQEAINELVSQVNTATKELETEVKTQSILQNLEGIDRTNLIGQKVAAEVNCELICSAKGLKKGDRLKIVLFKEMVIYARVNKTKMKYKGTIGFAQLRLIDIADQRDAKNIISIEDRQGGEPIEVSASSLMEKKQFLDQFSSLQKAFYSKSASFKSRTPSYSRATAKEFLSNTNDPIPASQFRRPSAADIQKPGSPRLNTTIENLESVQEPIQDRVSNETDSSRQSVKPLIQPKNPRQGFSYFGPVNLQSSPSLSRGKPTIAPKPIKFVDPSRFQRAMLLKGKPANVQSQPNPSQANMPQPNPSQTNRPQSTQAQPNGFSAQ